jgi:hypothetical protein
MKNAKTALVAISLIVGVSLSCKFIKDKASTDASDAPAIDFTTPSEGVDVKVVLDKKHTSTGKIGKAGGSVSLTSADGSKFKLDIPANALDADTSITMTAVKTLDGAPLDTNTPSTVQLEPSGLLFNEMLTLTIVPAKEIPIEKQVMFGYHSEGEDYHLLPIDHKSEEIRIKLMHFSGGGVGSASDVAWAANLAIQARDASARLEHKMGQYFREQRHEALLGISDGDPDWVKKIKNASDQYEDEVIRKEMVAAELDCRYARTAINHLLGDARNRALVDLPERESLRPNLDKLVKVGKECKKAASFQIVGGLDDWQTNTKVCDIMQPFTLKGGGFSMELSGGLDGTYSYRGPMNTQGTGTYTISLPEGLDKPGTMTGSGEGSAEGYSGSGTEKYTLTPIEDCAEQGPGNKGEH